MLSGNKAQLVSTAYTKKTGPFWKSIEFVLSHWTLSIPTWKLFKKNRSICYQYNNMKASPSNLKIIKFFLFKLKMSYHMYMILSRDIWFKSCLNKVFQKTNLWWVFILLSILQLELLLLWLFTIFVFCVQHVKKKQRMFNFGSNLFENLGPVNRTKGT